MDAIVKDKTKRPEMSSKTLAKYFFEFVKNDETPHNCAILDSCSKGTAGQCAAVWTFCCEPGNFKRRLLFGESKKYGCLKASGSRLKEYNLKIMNN